MTYPHPKRNFVPRAVLMKSGLKILNIVRQNSSRAAVSVNTARPINTAYPRPIVNSENTASNVFNRAHSHVIRTFNKFITNKNSNFNENVNTIRENVTTVGTKAVISYNKGNEANVVKASACWVWRPKHKVLDHLELQEKGVIDSRYSRHMTRNKSYLSDYEEIDGGFVTFGGNSKGGKITGKGTDILKLTRKQSKTGKHGHENQKSTKRSQRIKAEARKVKPQSNPVKEKSTHGQQKSTTTRQNLTIIQFQSFNFHKKPKITPHLLLGLKTLLGLKYLE
ncbi:hypothetical protein Tco_0071059 [Tanacetum coccineum]